MHLPYSLCRQRSMISCSPRYVKPSWEPLLIDYLLITVVHECTTVRLLYPLFYRTVMARSISFSTVAKRSAESTSVNGAGSWGRSKIRDQRSLFAPARWWHRSWRRSSRHASRAPERRRMEASDVRSILVSLWYFLRYTVGSLDLFATDCSSMINLFTIRDLVK